MAARMPRGAASTKEFRQPAFSVSHATPGPAAAAPRLSAVVGMLLTRPQAATGNQAAIATPLVIGYNGACAAPIRKRSVTSRQRPATRGTTEGPGTSPV